MTGDSPIGAINTRHWFAVLALVAVHILMFKIASLFAFEPVLVHTASAVSLAFLFFLGIRYWWIVWIAASIGWFSTSMSTPELLFYASGETFMAVAGAYALSTLRLDPIFRSFHDMLSIIVVSFAVAAFAPIAGALAVQTSLDPNNIILPQSGFWSLNYVGAACALLIVTPFVLRWAAKWRFGRNLKEITEIIGIFLLLVILNYLIFFESVRELFGVSLIYFLLLPLFWIALRLRPRFVTFAFVITAMLSVASMLGYADTSIRLFETEILLVVLAVIMYIVVSLEEERRLGANLMRQQLLVLENALARISSESKAKNDFIAVLAHELRNPLAPVVSGIDLLKLNENRDPLELETLNVMEDRMNMVRRLLDDLLDISRITENKIQIKEEFVDLGAALQRAIMTTEHIRKERHQVLEYKPPDEQFTIAGDAARLEQVFSNLLTNASKYSDPGDTITLFVGRTGDAVRIQISDHGIGIDPSLLEAIFMPFHQIESGKRTIKGLGIGLALVRNFVELHGGTVSARSEGIGHGSEFVVSLPLSTDALTELAAEEKPSANRVRNMTVLVVDDNDTAASGIGRLLEIQGHTALYAYTGGQALDVARSHNPDIVLLDLDLPDMDGYTVAKRLKSSGFKGRLIALTGLSSVEAKAEGKAAGFEQYLLKPVGVAELKAAMKKRVAK